MIVVMPRIRVTTCLYQKSYRSMHTYHIAYRNNTYHYHWPPFRESFVRKNYGKLINVLSVMFRIETDSSNSGRREASPPSATC
jgi:hypothetical protein